MSVTASSAQDSSRRVADLIHHLGTCRKAARVYPATHPMVAKGLELCMDMLGGVFREQDSLTLSVVEGELFADGVFMAQESVEYKELLHDLTALGLTSVTFHRGVELSELTAFVGLSVETPEELQRLGGFKATLESRRVLNIQLDQLLVVNPHAQEGNGEKAGVKATVPRELYRTTIEVIVEAFADAHNREMLNIEMVEGMVRHLMHCAIDSQPIALGLTTLKNFDEYTFYHSVNVAILSLLMGTKLRLNDRLLHRLGVAALLHDVGKVRVPDEILDKPGKLTVEEFDVIKTHPLEGLKILTEQDDCDELACIVAAQHHAQYDLRGYPNFRGLGAVHFLSHLVAVVDVYDALTSDRSYRRGMLPDQAMQIIIQGRGKMFHPVLAKVFANLAGMFPVGTVVQLDSGEVGVVTKPNQSDIFRPEVKVVSEAKETGAVFRVVNLADKQEDGKYQRTIVRSLEGDKHGIKVAQFS
jgi:putative nucleotidyltransferase with HDIG domain